MFSFENISPGFGRAKMPVENLFLTTCMEIAQRRNDLMTRALAEGGYIRDTEQNIKHLDQRRYGADIKLIATLFDRLQHSGALYGHCSGLARQAASVAKHDKAIADLREAWDSSDQHQRCAGLKSLSRIITDVLNHSEPGLCLNYPTLSLARFPAATRKAIAMQVQFFNPPRTQHPPVYLIAINDDMLMNSSFDNSTAQIWHEHQHVYMSGLRDMLRDGLLLPAHPLYKEAYKSKTVQDYKITGNITLAHDIYYAEPEEKLCFATQDIFNRVFRYVPEHPAVMTYIS